MSWRRIGRLLGPGFITGASDDDPSGIGTYSQVGAQLGFGLLWTMLFSYPLMSAIQEISARIGRVTGRGITGNLRRRYPVWLVYAIVAAVFIANTINIGADLNAMGAAMTLLAPGSALFYAIAAVLVSVGLQTFVPYARYAAWLRWMTLSLLAYLATAFVLPIPWETALAATFIPSLPRDRESIAAAVAVFGTTISPYLFFWQASQEVEELKNHSRKRPLAHSAAEAPAQLRRIKIDTYVGMAASNLIGYFIMLTCGATLYAHGIHDVDSAAQAAESLRPIAGRFAAFAFSAGIVGTGLLAVPVLAGSAACAVAVVFDLPSGLGRRPQKALGFYGVVAASTFFGLTLSFVAINPIKALFWSAVLNGLVAPPVMVLMMLMATDEKVMGRFRPSPLLAGIGWLATAVMSVAAIGFLVTSLTSL